MASSEVPIVVPAIQADITGKQAEQTWTEQIWTDDDDKWLIDIAHAYLLRHVKRRRSSSKTSISYSVLCNQAGQIRARIGYENCIYILKRNVFMSILKSFYCYNISQCTNCSRSAVAKFQQTLFAQIERVDNGRLPHLFKVLKMVTRYCEDFSTNPVDTAPRVHR